jgi:hypothetical protein
VSRSGQRRRTVLRRGSSRVAREIAASTFTFTERTSLEAGFAHVFRDRIVPILRRQEKSRQVMRAKAMTWIGAAGLAGAAGTAAGFLLGWGNATFIAPVLAVVAGFISYGHYQKKWTTGLMSAVIPVMCDFLGTMRHGGPTLSPAEFEDLGVVPYHTSASLDDTITGTHHSLGYTLTEARLTTRTRSSKGRTRTTTVFRGLLIRIELAGDVPEIYFARDRGGIANRLSEAFSPVRRGRDKIDTGAADFEALYETYTDDPAAARRFITRRLTDGLLEIARGETGAERYVAAATRGRGFYLAIPRTDDFLALGSLFRPLNVAEEGFHQCLADLALPRRVIEALGTG